MFVGIVVVLVFLGCCCCNGSINGGCFLFIFSFGVAIVGVNVIVIFGSWCCCHSCCNVVVDGVLNCDC